MTSREAIGGPPSPKRGGPGKPSPLQRLSGRWPEVKEHYEVRLRVHRKLLGLHSDTKYREFARLLLGISDPAGNYSAYEHTLGDRILATSENPNAERRVYDLATKLMAAEDAQKEVPDIIWAAGLRYLKIGVGSEASCLLNPDVCWIANTRTIWTHLLNKHADNFERANLELKLYRDHDDNAEMAYKKWKAIHASMDVVMTRLAEESISYAREEGVEPGRRPYLWADAICNMIYELSHT